MPSFLKKKKNLVVLFCLIFFQLILLSLQAPLGSESSFFEKTVFSIFSPLQNGTSSIIRGIGNLWKGYFSLRGVYKENKNIKKEVFFLQIENRLIRGLLDRSTKEAELKEILKDIRENIVFSRVIEIDLTNRHKSVIINRGLIDGIEIDMIVLDKFGQLVGRVIGPLNQKESRIQLITDSESGVSVHNQKDILGVINGNDEGRCILKYVAGTEKGVEVGDILVTSGFDHIYPPGIPIGEIITVGPADELFKNILVQPFFKFRSLDELAVIKLNPHEIF
ncbi:MAG: rod shape-determining protein MreC [Candidatus Aminicenantes bacterium]|nr:rod shape-determining protein MreC [Candidatus Aminicenantes bacterium]